jgi:methylenetetrahydrofolate dehydrogenase (NADP+) / methenyltetrahydrofolate cyclohydrolase
MKSLNGSELAGFIKERHAKQVRSFESRKIKPKLAIVQVKDDPVINTYVKLKQQYGDDIGVEVEVHKPKQSEASKLLNKLSIDDSVHGIIVQLPLEDPSQTDEIVNLVAPEKDVDALGEKAKFEPATPMAIMWLLAGYNVDLNGKKILLVGRGKLVGGPLEKILKASGHDVLVAEKGDDLAAMAKESDVIITATSSPGVLTSPMINEGTVVVDAGVAGEEGKTVGDVDPGVYERDDITITPQKGGVGPLTVCALFENVIRAAQRK